MKNQLNILNISFCFLSALGWVFVPVLFQSYLENIISRPAEQIWLWQAAFLVLVVGVLLIIEIRRFYYFMLRKPEHTPSVSLAAKLAQDRLWSIDLPNVLTNLFIASGGVLILTARDSSLAGGVIVWFVLTYGVQSLLSKQVEKTAQEFSLSQNNDDQAITLQALLLKKQILANGVGTAMRIGGQIVIYSLLFLNFVGSDKGSLPKALANIEYVALIFSSLQIVFSSLPKLQELRTYLETRQVQRQKEVA